MLPVNSTHVQPAGLTNYATQDTPVTGAKVGISAADLLPILASAGKNDIAIQSFFTGPELTAPGKAPSPEVLSELVLFLQGKTEDPDFTGDINKLHSKLSTQVDELIQSKMKETGLEEGKYLDISGFSSRAVSLLVAANILMLSLSQAETHLSSKLALVSYEATKTTAASLVREGMDMLSGAVSQSALQLGITGVGAKKEHSGIQHERGALKHNATKLNKLSSEATGIQRTLAEHHRVQLGADNVDGLTSLNLNSPNPRVNAGLSGVDVVDSPASSSIELGASNKTLSAEHKAVLQKRLESVNYDASTEELALGDNRLKAKDKQMLGGAIMSSGASVGGVAASGGQYAATMERSEQQISTASSRLSGEASDNTKEAAKKSKELLQELLRLMNEINQSKSATASAIAGNIRA